MTPLQSRIAFLLLSLSAAACVLFSLYLQHYRQWQPCILCLMQRYCLVAIAFLALMASRWIEKKRSVYARSLLLFFVLLGIYFSARQLWLQSLPIGDSATCLPSFDVLVQYFPWQSILQAMFMGTSDCGEHAYQWLGLSLPAWGLIYFSLALMFTLYLWVMQRKTADKP